MKKCLISILVVIGIARYISAGVIIEQLVKFSEVGKNETVVKRIVYISGDKMRTEYPGTGRFNIILLDKEILLDIDTGKGIYQQVNFGKEIKKIRRKKKEETAIRLDDLFEIKEAPGRKTISGYDCRQVIVTDPTGLSTRIWLARDVPGQEEFFAFYKKFAELTRGISNLDDIALMTSKLKEFNGMPMETEIIKTEEYNFNHVVTTVTHVMDSTIPEAYFKKPRGLKKIK